MPSNFKKSGKLASQCDAARGQQTMQRLTRVVQQEQRQQAKVGTHQSDATFNSQPQAGWKKEWKSTLAHKGDPSMRPDAAWTDDQAWLQGAKKCYDLRKTVPATKVDETPSVASSGIAVSGYTTSESMTSAGEGARILPPLPVLPETVSRSTFQQYVTEVRAAVQNALPQSSVQADSDMVCRYVRELAQALRVLTKPAPDSQKTRICDAMACVWDMRSNSPPASGAPLDLRMLEDALEALGKCCSSGNDQ